MATSAKMEAFFRSLVGIGSNQEGLLNEALEEGRDKAKAKKKAKASKAKAAKADRAKAAKADKPTAATRPPKADKAGKGGFSGNKVAGNQAGVGTGRVS